LTTTITDDAGNATIAVADLAGRTATSTDPNAGQSTFTYDPNGNITRTVDAVGNIVNTGYDALNRPTGRVAGDNLLPGGELLKNTDFEDGMTSWGVYAGGGGLTSSISTDPNVAGDWSKALAISTTGSGSVYQDTGTIASAAGDDITATVRVRAQTGTTSGVICVWAFGGTATEGNCAAFSAGTDYKTISVAKLNMTYAHTSFRFEISPNSGGGTILADTVSLTTGALDDRLAAWTYDRAPGGKGMAATETSWQDGLAYTTTVAGYNKRYQPTSTKINIPGPFTTDPLAGDWKFTTTFNEAGQPVTVTKPLVPVNPSLPGAAPGSTDVTTTGYNGFGQADQLWEGNAAVPVAATPRYVTGTTFDALGRVTERYLSRTTVTATPALNRSYGYNSATGALDEIRAGWTTTGGPATTLFQHDTYTRDAIGRVTRIDDNGLEGPTTDSNVDECFVYDNWNRLIRAHSVTGGGACVDDTVDATVASGSRDAYDTVWTFDDINRMRTTTDKLPGGATTTYGYAGNKHAVTGLTGPTTAGYTYDANGAMANRDGDALTYDAQQRLTEYSTTEEYVYTTTNQRLIRQAGGTRTLYLPGMEVSVTGTTRTINCYLTIGSTQIGTKTSTQPSGGSLTYSYAFACGNMQNTNVCQVNAGSGDIPIRKRYAPYGDSRQEDPVTFPNTDRGFLNQPEDANGLVYLNNRYHDPTLGHFISVDPLVGKTGQPYLYGDGNPPTLSDPTGLFAFECGPNGEGCSTEDFYNAVVSANSENQNDDADSGAWKDLNSLPLDELIALVWEIKLAVMSEDPDGWSAGVCAGVDGGSLVVGSLQGCILGGGLDSYFVGTFGVGAGTPNLSAGAGFLYANADPEDLAGYSLCYEASVLLGAGAVCGGVAYDQGGGRWVPTGVYSTYVGASASPIPAGVSFIISTTTVAQIWSPEDFFDPLWFVSEADEDDE
jgi:RHS repeat-associated protein